jgi:hypothetical protein
MKLRRESAGNGDFSGPKGEFKKRFSGLKSYRDTFRSENRFLNRKSTVIGDHSSRLHEICGLDLREYFTVHPSYLSHSGGINTVQTYFDPIYCRKAG